MATIMTCCLVLGSLASPAVAKTIVVTTLDDIANPPFDADGVCGIGTVKDFPGADGQVSLREAIIAANNTKGEQTITFASNLSGGTITINFDDLDADTNPDPLPALCGGQTRIDGDLNDDDVPDITLEGAALPVSAPPVAAAGLLVLSSHNTITGLQVQHFPIGIRVRAGDFTTSGTIKHTQVKNNIVAASRIDGIDVRTGDAPDSRVAHTTLAQNEVVNNARYGILVIASLSAAGSDSQIDHTTITDNEVMGNGSVGIILVSIGDDNILSDATISHNIVSYSTFFGINVNGGFNGADGNSFDVHVRDNIVADNGSVGLRVIAGQDNSSNNRVAARIRRNTLERNHEYGIEAIAGIGAANLPTGVSSHNMLDVQIEQNTVKDQTGAGIVVVGGAGSPDGRAGAIADHNQAHAIVRRNTVEGSTVQGIGLTAGGIGLANANTVKVWVAQNTACNNTDDDIIGEGGHSGNALFPVPNMGTENVLTGRIFQNTATMVTVQDGVLGNTADVVEFKNEPCL